MSDSGILETSNKWTSQYINVERRDSETQLPLPRRKRQLGIPQQYGTYERIAFDYSSVIEMKIATRHKVAAKTADHIVVTDTPRANYPAAYVWLAYLVFLLIGAGTVATIIKPSAVTEFGVPIGFTLWAVLFFMVRRRDHRNVDA